jgi:hypothetical protein
MPKPRCRIRASRRPISPTPTMPAVSPATSRAWAPSARTGSQASLRRRVVIAATLRREHQHRHRAVLGDGLSVAARLVRDCDGMLVGRGERDEIGPGAMDRHCAHTAALPRRCHREGGCA